MIIKIIFLQIFWLIVVLKCTNENSWAFLMASLLILFSNYFFNRRDLSLRYYCAFSFFVVLCGVLHDWQLIHLGYVVKDSYSFGYLSLWIVFVCYYNDIFKPLVKRSNIFLGILGGFGGSFAYWSALRLGALKLSNDDSLLSLLGIIFLFWFVFFPLSLRIFMMKNIVNRILDKSILFSFDRSGFMRHQKQFTEDFSYYELGIGGEKKALITGGTSGIGAQVAKQLASLGVQVEIVARDEAKGNQFASENKNVSFSKLDCAVWSDIQDYALNCEQYDFIVLNAGGMPEHLEVNSEGVEMQCASQLLGHYFLIHFLRSHKKLQPGARIVWVSSGGMYLKKLDLDSLFFNKNYDKVSTYANVKRAQVTLVEELVKHKTWCEYNLFCMHPGWVATSGLALALPMFFKLMKERLRTPKEGADTIIWLLLTLSSPSSGGFFFDRKKILPYFWNRFNPSGAQRALLVEKMQYFTRVFENEQGQF
ncbi:MAG: SDR family NAD(P)-dependent oxidoreductase [Bacteriovorax sp.]|nr:SDR family NAD(P)-dependent oxidoreductase [Bacteriovorax sp.]